MMVLWFKKLAPQGQIFLAALNSRAAFMLGSLLLWALAARPPR